MHEGDALTCKFRFLNLTEDQVSDLRSRSPVELKVRSRAELEGCSSVVVTLQEKEGYEWLRKFVQDHEIPVGACDFFVSLVSEYDTGIVFIPTEVRDLMRQIDVADLTFSYTIV